MHRALPLICLALAMPLAACGDDDDSSSGEKPKETTSAPAQSAPAQSAGGCERVSAPEPKPDGGAKRPKKELEKGDWSATVETNCGSFTIGLDLEAAPKTAASVVALARDGFYDGTVFHRIVPDFVIQGGDPTGTGTGGPGYKTVDEPPSDAKYTEGVVAMAKGGDEAPGTSGSQFFVVTGADAGLPPEYAVLGKVTKGLEVAQKIGRLGDAAEQPTETVVIRSVKVSGP